MGCGDKPNDTAFTVFLNNPNSIYSSELVDDFNSSVSSPLQSKILSDDFIACLNPIDKSDDKSIIDSRIKTIANARNGMRLLKPRSEFEFEFNYDNFDATDQVSLELLKIYSQLNKDHLDYKAVRLIESILIQYKIKDHRDLYNYLTLSLALVDFYSYSTQNEKAYSTLFQGLNVLNKYDSNQSHIGIRDEFYEYSIILALREIDSAKYHDLIQYFYPKLSKAYLSTFDGLKLKSYIAQEEGIEICQDSTLKFLIKAKKKASIPFEHYTIDFNLGIYYWARDQDQAKYYFERALQYFESPCHREYFKTLIVLLNFDVEESNYKEYIDNYNQINQCSDKLKDIVLFLLPNYSDDITRITTDQDSILALYQKSREIAQVLYPGASSLHLQDFYGTNYARICNLIAKNPKKKNQDIQYLINTALDTKTRDLHRQQLQYQNNSNSNINDLLLSVNEFKSYSQDKKLVYEKLFKHYLDSTKVQNDYSKVSINIAKLSQKLINERTGILNIFRIEDSYILYYYDGKELIIKNLDRTYTDSIGTYIYNNLSNHKKGSKNELSSLLKSLETPKIDKLVIIPDGIFTYIPLLPEHLNCSSVFVFSNVSKYSDAINFIVDNSNSYLFSFSSKKDILIKAKLEYREMPYSIKEINSTAGIINVPRYNIKMGRDLDFTNYGPINLLHMSTHAYASNTNRLNNFILIKDQDGVPSKVFGYNFYNTKHLPKVAILSACETGIGLPAYGAGVQTLSRAFLDNGTQTVIKTLWKVNEKATAEFMIQMYTHWVTGISLHDALQKTKDYFITHEEYAHPYYWAGFVLEGNPHVYLEQPENSNN